MFEPHLLIVFCSAVEECQYANGIPTNITTGVSSIIERVKDVSVPSRMIPKVSSSRFIIIFNVGIQNDQPKEH